MGGNKEGESCVILIAVVALLIAGVLPMVLLFALAFSGGVTPIPVLVTVDEASLGRLALVAPGNGTASVAYNLSFAVTVRNPSLGLLVRRGAPLDAELRLAGNPFALVRLAPGPETETTDEDLIRPMHSQVYRGAAAAAKSAPVELGSDAVAAFARQSVVGMFRLEIVVSGEFKYESRGESVSRITTVSCPLRLPVASAPAAVAFARFERTLPQPCTEISDN